MTQQAIRAVYMRGGTSRAIVFRDEDLPKDRRLRDAIFAVAIGSPDPGRRQLDGMGGGISSLSKIAVVGPPSRPDADVDYTFVQMVPESTVAQYKGNCGNISSAIGPFAVDEGLVAASGATATVRVHNTNTGKIIVETFALDGGKAAVDGDFVLQGVAGTGAPIRLAFLLPGGAGTGKLLPTGNTRDTLDVPGLGRAEVSLVDAANPVVFIAAATLGLEGTEMPDALERHPTALKACEELRVVAALAIGVAKTEDEARTRVRNIPQVGILSRPREGDEAHIVARMISTGQPHRATPLTGAMCLAAAMRLPGTLAAELARLPADPLADLVIRHPTGKLPVAARVTGGADPVVEETIVYRTARRLMEGAVLVPGSRVREIASAAA
jgi:2-methylaconitate cis-trans-isomerase PrpF